MIKQEFNVENYWKVIVYYDVDYNFFDSIYFELKSLGVSKETIDNVYKELVTFEAKAVTFNNYNKHTSVVLFNPHSSAEDYINSIVHEATHVMQAMLKVYHIKNTDESPAYTVGHLVMKMYEVFKSLVCN